MGRRKKVEILENPTEFDFEVRPKEIIPEGFEHEVMQKISECLNAIDQPGTNPVLKLAIATNHATYFRFEGSKRLPALLDLADRPIGEDITIQLRIHGTCCVLEEPLPEATLYSEDSVKPEFNGWQELEVEYKGPEDPRLRRLLKYP